MAESPTVQGIEMFRRGRMTKARELLESAIEARPRDALALSFLALVDALENRDLADCEERCFRAAMMAHGNAQVHANLARVQLLADRRKAAVDSVGMALSADPKNEDALKLQSRLGRRQRPAISGLARENTVNKTLGKLTHKLRVS